MNDAFIFDLDADIVDKTIHIRQKNKIKLPDAIVAAATALVNNLELITRNTSDFKNISGLKVTNPHLL